MRTENEPPPAVLLSKRVDADRLYELRSDVWAQARPALGVGPAGDFVYAVNEVASNAVEHGGGVGWLRLWAGGHELVCEVYDTGPGMSDPAAGTARPGISAHGGYGLWLVRQFCSRVHIYPTPCGTTVRLAIDSAQTDAPPAAPRPT